MLWFNSNLSRNSIILSWQLWWFAKEYLRPSLLFFVFFFFNEVDFGEWKFYVQQKQLDLSTTPLFLQDDGSYLYIPDREDYEKISLDISSFIIHLVQSIPSLPVVTTIPSISSIRYEELWSPYLRKNLLLSHRFYTKEFVSFFQIQPNFDSSGRKTWKPLILLCVFRI